MSIEPQSPRPVPGYPDVSVERNVPCAMRDGVVLRADIYRPAGAGPFPVILIRQPYDKTGAENIAYAHPAWYAAHGYIVVAQDNRGRWASDGVWYPFRDETDDGVDTIAWVAALPGSSGKVGMYGMSYGGATQMMPATQRPPALAAICPAMTGSQYYEGWTYNGGALALAFAASWATMLTADTRRRRGDREGMARAAADFAATPQWAWFLPLEAYPPITREDGPYFFDWLAHPTYDDYWRQWSIDEDYSRLDVPALHIAGWYDVFLGGTVKNYVGMRREGGTAETREAQRLVIGPWYHIPWKPVVQANEQDAHPGLVDDWQIAWFDRHLKGGEAGAGALETPVTIWLNGEERWVGLDAWPPTGSVPEDWHLHSGGRANSKYGDGALDQVVARAERPDVYTYDPASPSQSQGGHSCCFPFVAPMGPVDQDPSEQWNGVLVYTSAPLADDLLVIGEAAVVLHAATNCADTDFTARLCRVDPAGVSINIQEGIVRARYRLGCEEAAPIEPDVAYEYRIELGPVGIRIPAGHRLRVTVSSSDFPYWDRNLNTGGVLGAEDIAASVVATNVVLHDAAHPSRLILPVVTA